MILVFSLLLVVAMFLALREAERRAPSAGGSSWRWFGAWSVAGAAMTFAFLTGLSIGLLVLPAAAALLLWVASWAPHRADALGLVAGLGSVLVVVAFLNRTGTGVDPTAWLVAGLCTGAVAVFTYLLLRRRSPASA
jgi:ABC-type multidrug transport system fused ATPase/permease subunit